MNQTKPRLESELIPQREPLIQSQVAILERNITYLEESFYSLQTRLEYVSNIEIACGKDDETKEQSLLCTLAEHLRIQVKRIKDVIKRIEYQLSILEL